MSEVTVSFFPDFFWLKILCLEESSQLKLCDFGYGMNCKAALPNPIVCRKQGDENTWFTNLLVIKQINKPKIKGGKRKKTSNYSPNKSKSKKK